MRREAWSRRRGAASAAGGEGDAQHTAMRMFDAALLLLQIPIFLLLMRAPKESWPASHRQSRARQLSSSRTPPPSRPSLQIPPDIPRHSQTKLATDR